MKKLFTTILALLVVAMLSTSAMALSLSLDDWQFSPTMNGANKVVDIDEFTFRGVSIINSSAGIGNPGTFEQFGAMKVTEIWGVDSAKDNAVTGLGINYELTFVIKNAEGSFIVNDQNKNIITYNDAELLVYLDSAKNFGSASPGVSPIYGADDGILIGAFKLLTGTGTMDFYIPTPDGRVDLDFVANNAYDGTNGLTNGLLANTWFDNAGVDLSSYDPMFMPVLAFTDSNNQYITPTATQISEFAESGLLTSPLDSEYKKFFAKSDGSFDLGVNPIPEPGTLMLMGCGLIGSGAAVRKKMKSKVA